jgi:hypothetical protein
MDDIKRNFIVGVRKARIDNWCSHLLYDQFVCFLDEFYPFDDHYYRYCRTFASLVSEGAIDFAGKRIRETGHASPLIHFLKSCDYDAAGSTGDLRYRIEEESDSVDIMMSFEVMEHIKDQRETCFDDIVLFRETGVRTFANEINRVVRPEGVFVMTTPNANSLFALERLVAFEAPMLFRPHVREYTRVEVTEMFSAMVLKKYESHNSIFGFTEELQEARAVFERNGWDADCRGDLHFCVFQKPRGQA